MEVRAREIYDFIGNNPNSTEGEIARGCGLKRTPYTRMILFSLMEHHHISRFWDESRPKKAYVYYQEFTTVMDLK